MKQAIVFLWIGFAGTNTIAQTNTFPSSGNVGIGTTGPGSPLHVQPIYSTGSSQAIARFWNINGYSQIHQSVSIKAGNPATDGNANDIDVPLSVGTIGGKSIIAAGNVGIGTASPGALLDISGSSNGGSFPAIILADTYTVSGGSRNWAFANGYESYGTFSLKVSTTQGGNPVTGTPVLTALSSGSIGIGTTSPGAKLDVRTDNTKSAANFYDRIGNLAIDIDKYGSFITSTGIINSNSIGTDMVFSTGATEVMRFKSGKVGIGTTSPSEKFSVNGNIKAQKLIVTQTGWSDYVFIKGYKLRSLQSLETFINRYKHLPEVPTAMEVAAKGISVGDNQALLLKKIEELTLYMIRLNKKNDELIKRVQTLEKNIK
ncbi:MAG: hypothetical protein M0Q26_10020 [Chitinophagaceae bacterium]|nr:hypothetical protein [Chitinophagaceae bacterium]